MDGLLIFFGGTAIIGFALSVWINTKSGKKWLSNL